MTPKFWAVYVDVLDVLLLVRTSAGSCQINGQFNTKIYWPCLLKTCSMRKRKWWNLLIKSHDELQTRNLHMMMKEWEITNMDTFSRPSLLAWTSLHQGITLSIHSKTASQLQKRQKSSTRGTTNYLLFKSRVRIYKKLIFQLEERILFVYIVKGNTCFCTSRKGLWLEPQDRHSGKHQQHDTHSFYNHSQMICWKF